MDRALVSAGITAQLHFAETVAEAWRYLSGDGAFTDRTVFPLPKFIITDLSLPGENGFGLLQRRDGLRGFYETHLCGYLHVPPLDSVLDQRRRRTDL
jgi:hypothetical protein